jgi:hypothetical protein
VPIVLISLIDVDRQWFKAKVGMEGKTELPRKRSLCNRILLEESPVVIATEDVRRDQRFVGCHVNWMEVPTAGVVTPPRDRTGQPEPQSVRFYAAVALMVDGMKIGSLSLYDSVPRRDLVDKALKLLPDFGHIISDAMDRRHKLQLGSGSELAELSMSVMYNLKFPLVNMQTTLSKVGEYTAFQPRKRVSMIPAPADIHTGCVCGGVPSSSGAPASPRLGPARSLTVVSPGSGVFRTDSLDGGDGDSSDGHSLQSQGLYLSHSLSRSLPTSPMAMDTVGAVCSPVPPGVTQAHPAALESAAAPPSGTVCGPHCIHHATTPGQTRQRKLVHKDALRAEKEDLLDQMFELRRRGATLIKVLDHSISLAHSLQALHQRRTAAAAALPSHAGTHNIIYSSMSAHRKPVEDASQEKMYNNSAMYTRLRKMYRACARSPLCSADMTLTIDPVLVHCQENEFRRYQFSSRALTLATYSCVYHASRLLTKAHLDVHVRFEERDTAVQLQRLTSPSTASARQHGHSHSHSHASHKLTSPSSAKTVVESGKQTRLSSFTTVGLQHFMLLTGSGSSDGEITRDSIDYNTLHSHHQHGALIGSRRSSIEETGRASPDIATGSNNSSAEKRPFPIPSPINIPAFFTSPRSSLYASKTITARSLHSAGDLVISFRCTAKGSNNHTPTEGEKAVLSAEEKAAKSAGWSHAMVETAAFENTILKNILSTVNGGFVSTSGSGYNPDAPTAAGLIGSLFSAGGSASMALGASFDGTGGLPPSTKFNPREMLEEIREDCGGEGEVYMVTIRIPCNIISPAGDHPAGLDAAGSKDSNSTGPAKDAPRTPQQMRAFQPVVLSGAVDNVVLKKSTGHPVPAGKPYQLSAIPSIRSFTTASSSTRASHLSGSSRMASVTGLAPSSSCASLDLADSCKTVQGTGSGYEHSAAPSASLRTKPSASGAGGGMFGKGGIDKGCLSPVGEGSTHAALAVRHKQPPAGASAEGEGEEGLTAHVAPQARSKPKPAAAHSNSSSMLPNPLGLFTAIGNATRAVLSLGGATQRRRIATETTIAVTPTNAQTQSQVYGDESKIQ